MSAAAVMNPIPAQRVVQSDTMQSAHAIVDQDMSAEKTLTVSTRDAHEIVEQLFAERERANAAEARLAQVRARVQATEQRALRAEARARHFRELPSFSARRSCRASYTRSLRCHPGPLNSADRHVHCARNRTLLLSGSCLQGRLKELTSLNGVLTNENELLTMRSSKAAPLQDKNAPPLTFSLLGRKSSHASTTTIGAAASTTRTSPTRHVRARRLPWTTPRQRHAPRERATCPERRCPRPPRRPSSRRR